MISMSTERVNISGKRSIDQKGGVFCFFSPACGCTSGGEEKKTVLIPAYVCVCCSEDFTPRTLGCADFRRVLEAGIQHCEMCLMGIDRAVILAPPPCGA